MNKEQQILETIAATVPNQAFMNDDAFVDEATGAVFSTDTLVEGRHFSLDYFAPQDLGWKLAAASISDIAATGAQCRHLLISLGLPDWVESGFIEALYIGIQQCLVSTGAQLAGGDIVYSPHLVLTATAVGQLPKDHHAGRRFAAKPGDYIITTGYPGLSMVGLHTLTRNKPGSEAARQAHLRPKPRIEEGLFLSARFRRFALMDTSDGLADALLKIAQASQVRLEVDAEALICHDDVIAYATETGQDVLDTLLYGGEDFQLLATVPAWQAGLHPAFQIIGQVKEGPPQALLHQSGAESRSLRWDKTYDHFSADAAVGVAV